MMNGRVSIAIIAAAGLVAGAGGYWVGASKSMEAKGSSDRFDGVAMEPSDSESRLQDLGRARPLDELDPQVVGVVESGLRDITNGDVTSAMRALLSIEDEVKRTEAYYELIGRLDAAQMKTFVYGILSSDDEEIAAFVDLRGNFAVFDRWVELDMASVEEFIAAPEQRDANGRSFEVDLVSRMLSLAFIAQRDESRAMVALDSMGGNEAGPGLETILAVGIALDNPVAGVRRMREAIEKVGGADLGHFEELFVVLGGRMGEALPELLTFPAGEMRAGALEILFGEWGMVSPTEALAAAEALGEEGDALVRGVAEEWMGRDPGAALEWASGRMDDAGLARLVHAGERGLSPEMGMAAVAALTPEARAAYFELVDLKGSDRSYRDHFLFRMAAGDAVATIEWLREQGGMEVLQQTGVGVRFAEQASGLGFEHAREALELLPEGEFRAEFLSRTAMEGGVDDRQAALAWADGLPAGERDDVMGTVLSSWAGFEPEAATNYVADQNDAPECALNRVVTTWSQSDPGGAYRWMFEHHGGEPEVMEAAVRSSGMLESWVGRDPAAAAEAMRGFPEELAPDLVGEVIGSWAEMEPSRVSAYINDQLEPGPVRDAAVGSLVREISGADPDDALRWAGTIADETMRAEVIGSLGEER